LKVCSQYSNDRAVGERGIGQSTSVRPVR
jgi:hypothetical protein